MVLTGRVGNGETVQGFVVSNGRQAGDPGEQAENIGQGQAGSVTGEQAENVDQGWAGSVTGKQAENRCWSVSHDAEYSLALGQSQAGAYILVQPGGRSTV